MPLPTNDQRAATDVILREYSTLRDEAHRRLAFYFNVYQLYVVVLAAALGFIIERHAYDVLLVLPVVSMPLLYRLLWDQRMVRLIDEYIEGVLSPRLNSIIGHVPWSTNAGARENNCWFGWFSFFQPRILNRPKGYKHSIAVLFVLVPLGGGGIYAAWHVFASLMNWVPLTAIEGRLSTVFFLAFSACAFIAMARSLFRIYGAHW